MTLALPLRRIVTEPATACLAGCLLLAVSAYLVLLHARAIRAVTEVGIPTAQRLAPLENRLAVLREQVEAAEIQSALRTGAEEEAVRTSVLPARPDLDRIIGIFEVLRDALSDEGMVASMSTVDVGGSVAVDEAGLSAYPVRVSFQTTDQGERILLKFFEIAGYLTVGDALTPREVDNITRMTETENPAAIPALEQFLSVPLLSYAREPKRYYEQLQRAFSSESFVREMDVLVDGSALPAVRHLLGGTLGLTLEERGLWPLRFLTLERVDVAREGAGLRLSLELFAYGRDARE